MDDNKQFLIWKEFNKDSMSISIIIFIPVWILLAIGILNGFVIYWSIIWTCFSGLYLIWHQKILDRRTNEYLKDNANSMFIKYVKIDAVSGALVMTFIMSTFWMALINTFTIFAVLFLTGAFSIGAICFFGSIFFMKWIWNH